MYVVSMSTRHFVTTIRFKLGYAPCLSETAVLQILLDLKQDIGNQHVLIVEDIIDSGTTIHRLAEALRGRNPASVELCALLNKNLAPELPIRPRWVGFDAPADFLVGYGLDHAEDYRHLPFVASIAG